MSDESTVLVAIVCGVAALSGLAMVLSGEVVYGTCVMVASAVSTTMAVLTGRKR